MRSTRQRSGEQVVRVYLLLSFLEFVAEFLLGATGILFFRAKGFDSAAIGVILATYWWTSAIFEIPTGVLADYFGRKTCVVLSYVFRCLGYLGVATAPSVPYGVLGFFLVGIGSTFSSGAIEAWAVDESRRDELSKGLDRLFGLAKVMENAGIVFGSLVGAALGMLTLALPFFVSSLIFALAAVVAAASMTERRATRTRERRAGDNGMGADLVHVGRGAARRIRQDRTLAALLLLGTAPRIFGSVAGLQWSLYLASFLHLDLWILGGVRSGGYFLQAGVAATVMWFLTRGRVSRQMPIAAGVGGGGLGLLLAAGHPAAIPAVVGYMVFVASIGAVDPSIRAALNERISSDERATLLSMHALVTGLLTGMTYLLIGRLVADLSVVHTSWRVGAVGLVATGLPLAWLLRARPTRRPIAEPAIHGALIASAVEQ